MSFIEDKLNREARQLVAQREKLVAALEEIHRNIRTRGTSDALVVDIKVIATKALRDARTVER